MRIVLAENIPWPVAEWLISHEVTSVQREGWSGIQNGELIEKINGVYDLFITADKNLRYQQNLRDRKNRDIGTSDEPVACSFSHPGRHCPHRQ